MPSSEILTYIESIDVLMSQRTSPIINRADVYFALVNTLIYGQEQQSHAARPTVPPQGRFVVLLTL